MSERLEFVSNQLMVGKAGLAPQRGCPAGDPALSPLPLTVSRSANDSGLSLL